MNKKIYQIFLIVAVAFLVASCGKKVPKQAKYIPKDASAVVVINPKSLDEKLKSGNLSLDSFLNRFKDEMKDFSLDDKKKWEDFKNSGISLEENIFFFMLQTGTFQKGITTSSNILVSLKDKDKFEKFIKSQKEFKAEDLSQEKDFAYLSSNENLSMAWNKEVVILSFSFKPYKSNYDSAGNYIEPNKAEEKAAQKTAVTRYFSLKDHESITSVSYFNDMFKTKADGYFLSSTAGALNYLTATPLNIPKLQELLEDNYTTATFSFEKGSIDVVSTFYANPMLSSILKKYAGAKVNTHLAEFFPSQQLNGTLLFSFNPELFDGLLKELEVKGLLESVLTQVGLTSADVFKALKGEINMALSDFSITTKEVTYPSYDGSSSYKSTKTTPEFKFILTAPVGDKVAYNNLMNKGVEYGFIAKTSTGYGATDMMASTGYYFSADEKIIVFASSEEVYKAYLANKTKSNISADVLSTFSGKTAATFFDINSFLTGIIKSTKEVQLQKILTSVNNTFKNVVGTTNNFSGNSIKSNVKVTMANNKENSLVSILNLITDVYNIAKEEKKTKESIEEVAPSSGY